MLKREMVERVYGECDLCGIDLTTVDIIQIEKGQRDIKMRITKDGNVMTVSGIMCRSCAEQVDKWLGFQRFIGKLKSKEEKTK